MRLQIQCNINLGIDVATLLFLLGFALPTNIDSYMNPHPEDNKSSVTNALSIQYKPEINELPALDKSKLLYYVNKFTSIYRLCIPLLVPLDILAITYKKSHLGFSCYFKIIACSWFIYGLTKFFRSFI